MMSPLLRAALLLLSLFVFCFVLGSIRKRVLQIRFALGWLVLAAGLFTAALWPGLVELLCAVMQIQTPGNLLCLAAVLLLFAQCFYQTLLLSKQEEALRRLTQHISLYRLDVGERNAQDDEDR